MRKGKHSIILHTVSGLFKRIGMINSCVLVSQHSSSCWFILVCFGILMFGSFVHFVPLVRLVLFSLVQLVSFVCFGYLMCLGLVSFGLVLFGFICFNQFGC